MNTYFKKYGKDILLIGGLISLLGCASRKNLPQQTLSGDLDGNGKPDLVQIIGTSERVETVEKVNSQTYDLFVKLDNGRKGYLATIYSMNTNRFELRDYNGDGNLDIYTIRDAEAKEAEAKGVYVDGTIFSDGKGGFYRIYNGVKRPMILKDHK